MGRATQGEARPASVRVMRRGWSGLVVGAVAALLLVAPLGSFGASTGADTWSGTWERTEIPGTTLTLSQSASGQVSGTWTWNDATGKVTGTSKDGTLKGTFAESCCAGSLELHLGAKSFSGSYSCTSGCNGTGPFSGTCKAGACLQNGTGSSTTTTTTSSSPCATKKGTRRVSSARAVNEVRVLAVQPGAVVHRAGTEPDCILDLTREMVLHQGDEIGVDPDGSVTLQFTDLSTTVVRNTTQLKIASYFTEGGVVRTEILLKMGEIASKVNKSEATKSDFRINNNGGHHAGSVRGLTRRGAASSAGQDVGTVQPGSSVTVFADPVTNNETWNVLKGSMAIALAGHAPVTLSAGQEVQVTPKTVSAIAPIGKAGARGGINILGARDLVLKTVAANNGPCALVLAREGAFAIRPAASGWLVSVKAVAGKVKGWSTWKAAGSKVAPVNAAAKKIARGCASR